MNMLALLNMIMGTLATIAATMATISAMIHYAFLAATAVCAFCPECPPCCSACPYAIKHGIVPHEEPGSVKVSARPMNGGVMLAIRDSGTGPSHDDEDGHGLAMTRQRLETLYGDRFLMVSRKLDPHGYEIAIRLPDGGQVR